MKILYNNKNFSRVSKSNNKQIFSFVNMVIHVYKKQSLRIRKMALS